MNYVGRSLQQYDYVLKLIIKFSEIDLDLFLELKIFYFFDDVFGIFNCDILFIDILKDYNDVEVLLRYRYLKLFMISRNVVYRKIEKFNFLVVFYVIDLNDFIFFFNDVEKNGIFQNICKIFLVEYLDKVLKCKYYFYLFFCVFFFDFFEL